MRGDRAGPLRDGTVAGLVVLLASIIASGAVLWLGESQFRDEVDADLRRAAEMTATTIDGDLHRSITEPEQETSPEYERAIAPLDRIRRAAQGFRFVYTVIEREGSVYFVLDPTPAGDADGDGVDDKSHVMDEYDEASPEMLQALRSGQPTVEAEPTTDRWGTFLTGYAPFFDSAGKLAGVVGVDVSADDYLARVNRLRGAALFGILIGALIGSGVGASVYWLQRGRQQVDLALGESEARFAIIANHAPVMLWVTDAVGEYVFANPAWLAFTGATQEELAGRGAPPGLDEAEAEVWRDSLREACRAQGDWNCEVRQRRADGEERWIVASAKPRRLPDGHFAGHVGFALDLTERKLTELELRAARDASESASRAKSEFVAKISHELRTPMNGVLGLTELLLRTALTEEQREWARLIAASGESLLKLVNDVLDFAQLDSGKLVLASEPFDLQAVVEDAVRVARECVASKPIGVELAMTPDVPRCLVGDASRLHQVLGNLLGNAVKFTERGCIRLVVTPEGEVAPSGAAQDSAARIRFSVEDTGIGIPLEHQSRLFEAFAQVDSSAQRRHAGTGLGLVIARQLVRSMDGEITLSSTPGGGSVFTFDAQFGRPSPRDVAAVPSPSVLEVKLDEAEIRPEAPLEAPASAGPEAPDLVEAPAGVDPPEAVGGGLVAEPLARQAAVGAPEAVAPGRAGVASAPAETRVPTDAPVRPVRPPSEPVPDEAGSAGPRGGGRAGQEAATPQLPKYGTGLRVLLAEDNMVNQKVAARLLTDSGFEVVVAADGVEAVNAFGRERFDLILMDCQMPEMNGFEATRRIRELAGNDRIPIIALTANALPGDRRRCLEAGMDDYVTKPIRPVVLRSVVERRLRDAVRQPAASQTDAA